MAGKKIVRKGAKYKKKYKSPGWYKPKGYKQSAQKNNNWKNGKGSYRARALKAKGRACSRCGKRGKVEVDHISSSGTRKLGTNHKLKNLRVMCPSCHRKSQSSRRGPHPKLRKPKRKK